jgi:hypothetical protein
MLTKDFGKGRASHDSVCILRTCGGFYGRTRAIRGQRVHDMCVSCWPTGSMLHAPVRTSRGGGNDTWDGVTLPNTGVYRLCVQPGAARLATGSRVRANAAAGVVRRLVWIGAGLYVVGGWLLLSRLVVGGLGPIEQTVPAASPAFNSRAVAAAPRVNRGGIGLKPLIVSIMDGLTYRCFVPADGVSADEIVVTSTDFVSISRGLECN